MLQEFKHYFKLAKMKQEQKYENKLWTNEDIGDDLVNHVPIYDVIHRKYAAFSKFTEAVYYKKPGFESNSIPSKDFAYLCYLFRLCGSGINYKSDHGFGNFWIVDQVKNGYYRYERWLENLPDKGFCDVKGYLLPMIPKGLKTFILEDSYELFNDIYNEIQIHKYDIPKVVDLGNHWLRSRGFKRQNFVLTAFAMDLAEYTSFISKQSDVLCGSNAKKCLKLIFPNERFKENIALDILIDETGNYNYKMDMEDVACDFIRYVNNFQSPDHIKLNNGIIYENSLSRILQE